MKFIKNYFVEITNDAKKWVENINSIIPKPHRKIISYLTENQKDINVKIHPFNLNFPVLYLHNKYNRNGKLLAQYDPLFLRDCCESILITGSKGSGKSSGAFKTLSKSFLRSQYGGIFLCVKPDDVEDYTSWIKEAGREKDIIYLSKEKFDFLHYENTRGGSDAGKPLNLVHLITSISQTGKKGSEAAKADNYFDDKVEQLCLHTINLLQLSNRAVNLETIYNLVRKYPVKDLKGQIIIDPALNLLFEIAENKADTEKTKKRLKIVKDFILEEYPNTPDKTRDCINSTFTILVQKILLDDVGDLLCSGTCTFDPQKIIEEGKLLIVDYQLKKYGVLGKIVNVIMKTLFQKALERRTDKGELMRPFCFFADEFQNFITDEDFEFEATARSSKAISIYATQTINNLFSVLGKRDKALAFLENINIKIAHKNSCKETNEYFCNKIDEMTVERSNASFGKSAGQQGGSSSQSTGYSEQKERMLKPYDISKLLKGGPQNNSIVSAYLYKNGDIFSNSLPYIQVYFNQNY